MTVRERQYRDAANPVLVDLNRAGYQVSSILELTRLGRRYPDAVPILEHWLTRARNPLVQENIARALSVPWARSASPVLIEVFQGLDGPSEDPTGAVRWAIGNALSVVADDLQFEALAQIAQDRRYGRSREMVAVALGRMKRRAPEAGQVLVDLLEDPEMTGHAVLALGKLRYSAARDALVPMLNHPNPWIRREAKKALERLGKPAS